MSESRRKEDRREDEYPPQAGNTSLTIVTGPPSNPRTFTFSSPHRHFSPELNRVMMNLPELLERISPEESEVYQAEQNVVRKAANYTATLSDYLVLCDASAGGFVVSLPTATAMGKTLVIVKTDSTGNAITLTPFGNDTIQGSTSLSLSAQWAKAILTADGVTTWIDEGTGET